MTEKITLYTIKKELVREKIGLEAAKSDEIKDIGSNYGKQLTKVLNKLNIDEELFKEGKNYSFEPASKEIVKDIIRNHSEYTDIISNSTGEQTTEKLTKLSELITKLLKNEIKEESLLYSELAKLELTLSINKKQLYQHLVHLLELDLVGNLNNSDDEVVMLYYIEELMTLKKRVNDIKCIFDDLRGEEIVAAAAAEFFEGKENTMTDRIPLDKLIVKDLIANPKRKSKLHEGKLENLEQQTGLTEEKLIEALKKFKKEGYKHELFELAEPKDFLMNPIYTSPFELLQQAKRKYEDKKTKGQKQREKNSKKTKEELNAVKQLLDDRNRKGQ